MAGPNVDASRLDQMLASRYRPFTSSKISWLRGSRLNAWTARMPPSDSTYWTITSTIARRTARYDRAELWRNHQVSASTSGMATRVTTPSRASRWTRITVIATTESSDVTTEVSPVASSSLSASTSEVRREMMRPDVYRS